MGGTGHWPVPSGDSPDGTGTTPCGNECLPTVGAPSSFRPASGRAARAGRPCHPDKCEISGLTRGRLLHLSGGQGFLALLALAFAEFGQVAVLLSISFLRPAFRPD